MTISEIELEDGMIPWSGGKSPINSHSCRVAVQYRSGFIFESNYFDRNDEWLWNPHFPDSDIVGYKIVQF